MQVLSGDISSMPPLVDSVTVTMGNFDGVHRGHSHLISQLKAAAARNGSKTAVLSFDPHPEQILSPDTFLGRLSSAHDQLEAMEKLGVDFFVIQAFSESFSRVSREDFLRQYLVPFFNPVGLLLGYDFRFGKDGGGDYEFAKASLPSVEVTKASPLMVDGSSVSSTRIRKSLLSGKVEDANLLLGRLYGISGVVERGQELGRQLGFPTANIGGIKTLVPGDGVYAGFAWVNNQRHRAVLNIGRRPTLGDSNLKTCECHLLDFSDSLYGANLRFEFYKKIRSEKKFDGLQSLKEQISKDLTQVSEVLETYDQTIGHS